jgi:tripartite-type tricarboxylate transporter receptor subunit TctC
MARLALSTLAAGAFLLVGAHAGAQSWPSKPIRLLVPLAAGSTADIIARRVGNELAKALGQPVVIDNKPGAGGTIATAEVARAAPDGYTIGLASQGTLVFNQALYAKPGYDSLKDLTPIALAGGVSNVMIVPPSSTAREPRAIIDAAKAKPGTMTFSSGGSGTSHHLSGVLFGQMTGTDLVHVPYKGTPQGIVAVMSGEVTMGFFNTPTVISQIRDGKLRALAVTSLARSSLLPDVPTLDEKGVKGYEVNTWFGWVGPARLPADIANRFNSEIARILANPDVRATMIAQGIDVAPPAPPAAFGKLIADDMANWIPIVRRSGAKVD